LPYELQAGEKAEGVHVWYLDDNGRLHCLPVAYDPNEETITFTIPHQSLYVLGYTLYGDVNGDGVVDNFDLTRLLQAVNGWDVNVNGISGEVNGDGVVDNFDLTRLLQAVNGWDVTLGYTL